MGCIKIKTRFGCGLQMEVISPAVRRGWEAFALSSLLPGLTNWQWVSSRGGGEPQTIPELILVGDAGPGGVLLARGAAAGLLARSSGSAGAACSQGENRMRTSLP